MTHCSPTLWAKGAVEYFADGIRIAHTAAPLGGAAPPSLGFSLGWRGLGAAVYSCVASIDSSALCLPTWRDGR